MQLDFRSFFSSFFFFTKRRFLFYHENQVRSAICSPNICFKTVLGENFMLTTTGKIKSTGKRLLPVNFPAPF